MTPEKETELFDTLGRIVTMLQLQGERIARIEGILANAPQTAEFYELRGRVEEISRRLPTTLAYPQPAQRQS